MRKLVYCINISIDGCCDHTKISPYGDVHSYVMQLMADTELLLYGRTTYQLMVPFWPDVAKSQSKPGAMNAFAKVFDAINRVVVSRTLECVEDKQTTIIGTNLYDEVLKLKQQDGKNIMTGGISLPLQLAAMGLVDEFHFIVQPVMVGEGRRLVDPAGLQQKLNLKLAGSKVFESGCVAVHYVKAQKD